MKKPTKEELLPLAKRLALILLGRWTFIRLDDQRRAMRAARAAIWWCEQNGWTKNPSRACRK